MNLSKSTMQMISSNERNHSLDCLRLVACFMVVLLHTAASHWRKVDVTSFSWQMFNFYDSASRGAVPLFFMISGKLFLSKKEIPSIQMLFSKYISKLVVLYLFWGLLYSIDSLGFSSIMRGEYAAVFTLFVNNPKYHLWYLPSLVGVYLLLPVMWCVANYRDGVYLRYTCLMFMVFGIAWNTISLFCPYGSTFVTFVNRFSYALSSHSGYFLLGYYLSERSRKGVYSKYKFHHYLIAFLFVVVISTVIGSRDAIAAGKPKGLLYNNLALPACVEGILLFLAFNNINISASSHANKRIALMSRCTLFVYLFHPFLIEHFESWFNLHTESFSAVFSVPIIAAVVFMGSLGLALIVNRIPFVNKWLA